MRVIVRGRVVEVEPRSFNGRDGQKRDTFDAFIASDNPRYGADRISGPVELQPAPGDDVAYICNVTAREGQRGPYLSVWAVEALTLPVGA